MGGMAMPSPQEQMAMQQPMPMPEPMVSPEQIGEQMAQVESDAGAMGVGIGQELVNRMMQGLDSAETPKDLMDSIRGNDRSVDERRTELAEFVGEEDAEQTPETVLAMVQPTIMLTERGAMDSGVGELMEGVADVDMETMEGEPTDVGGGVASLMGVGQPPVQNFRNGGIVQKFAKGDPVSFADYVTQGAQIAESLYPSQDDYFKKMALLNLSNLGVTTGLGLASGRSPSGQPLGGNVVSKVAQIGTEIFPQITKSAMSLAQAKQAQEQARRQQALQIGTSLYQASKPEFKIADGRVIKINPDGTTEVVQDLPKREVKEEDYQYTDEKGNKQIINLNLNDPDDLATFKSLKKQYPTTFRGLRADSKEALSTRKFNILGDADLRERFRLGKATPTEVLEIQNILRLERIPQPIFNKSGERIGQTEGKLPRAWEIAEQEAKQYYPNLYGGTKTQDGVTKDETTTTLTPEVKTEKKDVIPNQQLVKADGSFVNSNELLSELEQNFKGITGQDFSLATGIGDIETAISDFVKAFGSEVGLDVGEFSPRGDIIGFLENLFTTTKLSLRDDIGGRAFATDVQNLEVEFPTSIGVKNLTDKEFLKRLKKHKGRIQVGINVADDIINNPMEYTKADVGAARGRKLIFQKLLGLYEPVIISYEQSLAPKKKERKIINLDR
jgi:hypothetical protein